MPILDASVTEQEQLQREGSLIASTLQSYLRLMKDRFRNFPNDYLVIDLETTGIKVGEDLIGQIGHCLVLDGKVAAKGYCILDWTSCADVDQNWLADRLEQCRRYVEFTKQGAPTGKKYHLSYRRLKEEGTDPKAVLKGYLDWLLDARKQRYFLVAHNGYHFDGQLLAEHFSTFLGADYRVGDFEMIDTGMVEKAAQANMQMWPEETCRSFSLRINSQFLSNVRWSLDKHCVPKYQLVDPSEMDQAHSADFDCYVTHLLFEKFKRIHSGEDAVSHAGEF